MKTKLFALFCLSLGMTCFAGPALNVNIVGVSPGSTFSVISAGEGLTAEHPHAETALDLGAFAGDSGQSVAQI